MVVGVLLGLGAASMGTHLLESFLYGVTNTDRLTFVSNPLILVLVGSIACYLPARRATKVDPMEALLQA